ncbi:PAS-domain containing protein [Ramlibacter sp. MAHUQ-53]|uniref:PAS-domain containing protein n=1 Tax=unclassified Ramlibacter TaxID=2617605 RepID=UPI0036407126
MLAAPIPHDDAARLRRLRAMDILDTGAEAALDGLTRLASQATGMPIALVSLVDQDRQWFKSAVGLGQGCETPRDVSFCGHAIGQDGIFEIEDALADPRFHDNPLSVGEPRVVHYAGVPLAMPEGERIGTLCLIDHRPGRLSPEHRRLLTGLAASVVDVLLLRERETRLRKNELLGYTESLAELSPVGLVAADTRGALVHANPRWLAMLGVPHLGEALGWDWLRAVHPQDRDEVRGGWESAIRRRARFQVDFRTDPRQPVVRWLRLRLEPADRNAGAVAFIGSVNDITEVRALQMELIARNEQLESIISALPSGLAVFDEDLRLVASNRRVNELLDLPEDVLGGPDARYQDLARYLAARGEWGAGDPADLVRARVARIREGQDEQFEHASARGSVLDVRIAHMPDGGHVRVYTDVTAQRRAEQSLRASEHRLAVALESVGLGLWELEPLAGRIHLSEGWSRFFGFAPEARSLGVAQMAELAPGTEMQDARDDLVRLLKGEIAVMQREHQMVDGRGERIRVVTHARVTERDGRGRAVRVVGTTQDVSDRHRAALALREAVDAANDANRAKADFLSTMSHEIRTPINGVIGLARMLEEARLPARESDLVRMINSCASTLLTLVNDVLDFSKIEAGQMSLEESDTDLHALVHETADIFGERARHKGVDFSVHLDGDVPRRVRADAHRLRQILLNLLGNALKFTDRGAFSLRASVSGAGAARMLRFDVTDSGIGISREDLPRLFKRFAQAGARTGRHHQGTGLGLAISRDLAVLMGGDVTAASTPGVGSTFTVTVPLRAAAVPAAQAGVPAAPPAAADAAILLVEDNAINQLVARSLLAKLGYRNITLAQDGREAVEAARAGAFDLVLMDCQMPVMDGFEAARALRADGFEAPIVALTAGAASQDRDKCLEAGMDDYLAKPIDVQQLSQSLGRWLHRQATPLAAVAG